MAKLIAVFPDGPASGQDQTNYERDFAGCEVHYIIDSAQTGLKKVCGGTLYRTLGQAVETCNEINARMLRAGQNAGAVVGRYEVRSTVMPYVTAF